MSQPEPDQADLIAAALGDAVLLGDESEPTPQQIALGESVAAMIASRQHPESTEPPS